MASGLRRGHRTRDRHSGAARRRWGGRRDAVPGTRAQERRPTRRGGQRRPHGHRTGPKCRRDQGGSGGGPDRGHRHRPNRPGAHPAPEPEAAPEPATYRGRLGKARGLLSGYLGAVRSKGRIDDATWDDLEASLIRADVGVGATDGLLNGTPGPASGGEIGGPDALVDALRDDLVAMLSTADASLALPWAGSRPGGAPDGGGCLLDAGADPVGVAVRRGQRRGQDRPLGKVAKQAVTGRHAGPAGRRGHLPGGRRRAAHHVGRRAGVDIVRGAEGGDPSAVVFDAVQRASAAGRHWCWPTPPAGCTPRST